MLFTYLEYLELSESSTVLENIFIFILIVENAHSNAGKWTSGYSFKETSEMHVNILNYVYA